MKKIQLLFLLLLYSSIKVLGQYKEDKNYVLGKIPVYKVYAHKADTTGVVVRNIILNPFLYNIDSLYVLSKPEMLSSKPNEDSTIVTIKMFVKKQVKLISYDTFLKLRGISDMDAKLPTYLNNRRLYDTYNSLVYNNDVSEIVVRDGRLLIFLRKAPMGN